MRRLISFVSITVALVALALVLYNATLVDRRAPGIVRVSLSAAAGDERLAQTLTAIDIQFSEPVRTSTVERRFRIEPFVAGAFAWDGTTAIFTPSAKLPGDTEFTILVEAGYEDLVGNVAEIGLEPWTFRTVGPPAIVRAAPADGAAGIPIDEAVDLEFDRLMDTASVEAAIHIDPIVPIRASWSGASVRLFFDSRLRFGTSYTLTVGPTAADTGGNRLRDPFTLHFSTVAAALQVVETVPTDGASGVGIRTPVAIRFDAPIDADSARAAFRITPSVDGEIRVVRVADDLAPVDPSVPSATDADTILFVPDDTLAPHTTYVVSLAPSVSRRNDPGAVAAGRSWTFTTGSPSTSGQNQVAFLSARSGVRNVWLMNPDGTNGHQLSPEIVPVSSFDATGDGSRVAYSAGGVVFVVNIDGSDGRQVTAGGGFEYGPVFTPDDDHLIVARRAPDGSDLGFWLVPLPGVAGDERRLIDHGAPALGSASLRGDGIEAADGLPTWMARTAFDPSGGVALIVTAAGEPFVVDLGPEPLAAAPNRISLASDASPAWSPRHDAFVLTAIATGDSGAGTESALWTISSDGSAEVIPGTERAVGPVGVGQDGALAVTVRASGQGAAGIGVLPRSATKLSRFAPATLFDDRWPTFSPDGGRILVGRTFVDHPDSGDGIWTLDLATGEARQISADGAYARWLP